MKEDDIKKLLQRMKIQKQHKAHSIMLDQTNSRNIVHDFNTRRQILAKESYKGNFETTHMKVRLQKDF